MTITSNGSVGASVRALQAALASLDDDKAENVVTIDLKGKSSFADYMVIASGRSHRHVAALADHLVRRWREQGQGRAAVEGLPQADWVLIDGGDVIVHLFRPEVREFYKLEKIWAPESPDFAAEADGEGISEARRARSGRAMG